VVSARVNLLTKTEDLDVADWYTPGTVTVETAIYTAPDSSVSGIRITALGFNSGISGGFTGPAARHTGSFFVRAGSTSALRFGINDGGWLAATATIVSGSGSITGSDLFSLSGLDSNWTEVRLVTDANIPASAPRLYFYPGPDTQANGDSIGVWHPQVETGSTATRYQRVTTATDYDTVGFPHYLVFDGIDDSLATAAIDFTATSKATQFIGRHSAGSTTQIIYELGPNVQNMFGQLIDGGGVTYAYARGDSGFAFPIAVADTKINQIVTQATDVTSATSIGASTVRINGVAQTLIDSGTAPGGGTLGNLALYIGSRTGSTLFFAGKMYGLVFRGAESSATEIENTEAYIARKAGVVL